MSESQPQPPSSQTKSDTNLYKLYKFKALIDIYKKTTTKKQAAI